MPVDYVFLSFENIRPNSNNKYIGTANINWEMTSGGVKIIPKVKQITKKIPRRFFKSFFVATPKEIIVLMMIGIWKPKPKATDSPRTKLKNLEISVEILIESGPIVWKKLNTLGRTIAIQNITPAKNKNVPRADREKTIFFSFLYKPGAINIKSWKIRNGIDISKAKKAVSLKGTKKGEATSIAISSKSGIIKIYSEDSVSLYEFVEDINKNYSKDEKLSLLNFMWRIAFADGRLDVDEEKIIRRLADLISIKDIEVLKLKDTSKN